MYKTHQTVPIVLSVVRRLSEHRYLTSRNGIGNEAKFTPLHTSIRVVPETVTFSGSAVA